MDRGTRFKSIGSKFTILFTIMALVLCIGLCAFSGYISWREYTNFFWQKALESAKLAACYVDGDHIGSYLETGEIDQAYKELYRTLQAIKKEHNIKYLYIFAPESNHFTYIMDVALEDESSLSFSNLGDIYEYTELEYEYLLPDVEAKRASQEKIVLLQNAYGPGVSAWAPVLDSEGNVAAYVEADLALDLVVDALKGFLWSAALVCCALAVLTVFCMAMITRKMVSTPVAELTNHVLEFASGESLAYPTNTLKTGDEMQALSEAFGKMAKDIDNYTQNLAAVAADKERIATELSLATDIQISLLPRAFPAFPKRDEFDIYAQLQPAKVMGGDFYDFFLIDQQHLGVVTGSVSGKGIPAALFMVVAKTIIKNQMMTGMDIEDAMSVINARLYESKTPGVVVRAFVGVLNTATGRFCYVNAGQQMPLFMRKDRVFEYLRNQEMVPLAETENIRYRKMELNFRQGDSLVLCTNGIFQAKNRQGEEFGAERLRKDLNSRRAMLNNLKELVSTICEDVSFYEGTSQHEDDLTILALRYYKGDRACAEITVQAQEGEFQQAQRFLRRQLEENNLSGFFYAKMAVAAEEAFALAVHSLKGSGEIVVRCAVDDEVADMASAKLVTVSIVYAGSQENPLEECAPTQQEAVAFMRRAMDVVEYFYQEGKNEICLRKRVAESASVNK